MIYVENLKKSFGDTVVLNGITTSVKKGEVLVILGPSGCGKSTFLRCLNRLEEPTEGSIYLDGVDITDKKIDINKERQKIMMVFQHFNLFPNKTILENLTIAPIKLKSVPKEQAKEKALQLLDRVGLKEKADVYPAQLSGGQKQLLNLASVMAMQPKLLLLDEPTSQLDPIAAADFIATLQKLNRELGLTILLAEHRLEEVFPIADKVIAMDSGKMLACGSPVEAARLLQKSKLSLSLPTAVRIWYGLDSKDVPPMTVRQGKDFLEKHYSQCAGRSVAVDKYSGAETVLEAKNVYFRYEKNSPDVLKGFNIAVTKGEIFSILGGNGTGKTTALNVLSGLDKPYKGSSNVFGKKISKYKGNSLYRNMVAMLPQNPIAVFVQSTVREDFYELLRAMDIPKDSAEKKVNEVTEVFNIEHLLNKHPYDLSGGEQQKAALAKLMLTEPKIILLDEPTKGLDAFYKESFAHILRKIKGNGVTSIIVTHDVEFAAEVSDRCGLFFDGQIIALDTPNEFFCNNSFYTTAASRMSRELFKNAVLCSQVIQLCGNEEGEECP